MKQIGLAFRIWAGDHNDEFPFNVKPNQTVAPASCVIPTKISIEQNPVQSVDVEWMLATPFVLVAAR